MPAPRRRTRCKGLGREKERERKNIEENDREIEREIEMEGLDEANAISKELLHEVKGSLPLQKELKGHISKKSARCKGFGQRGKGREIKREREKKKQDSEKERDKQSGRDWMKWALSPKNTGSSPLEVSNRLEGRGVKKRVGNFWMMMKETHA